MASIKAIIKEWEDGKTWVDSFTKDYPNLDNLADGVALNNVSKAPVVGDLTLSRAVRQIPRASIQQMPTLACEINGTRLSVDAIVADDLLRNVIFNQDTFGNGVLSTMQMSAESALVHGFQPLRANLGKIFNEFGTVLEAIHYNDIVIEPGVFDASDSSYYHVRTRVTKSKIKRLLNKALNNPNTKWNVKALQELLEMGPQSDVFGNRFLSEARQNAGLTSSQNQYDIITRYGVGPYHSIITYSPQLEKPLYKAKSKSKFGYPRVAFIVLDPAQLTPFGVSRVRLASPMANYSNIYLQSTAKMQLLNSDPPVFKRGLFTSATPLRRAVEWNSNDPNADVHLMELSNSTLQQFREVLDFTSNQVLSIMGVGGGSSGGGSSYENEASVKHEIQQESLGSNQVTAILENAIRQYALTALDLLISEQSGESSLIVDDESKQKINQIMGDDFVGEDNIVNVNWETLYDRIETWTVKVDLSMAKNELEDKKRADLQDMYTVMKQTANPNDLQSMRQANAIGDELVQDVVPEVSKQLKNEPAQNQQFVPPQPSNNVGTQS